MKFKTVEFHFLSDVFGFFSSKNFATMSTWCFVTSPLYYKLIKILKGKNVYKLAEEYVKT